MTIAAAKMLHYNRGADIDWSRLDFDPDDLKERDMLQDPILQEIGHILSSRFSEAEGRGSNFFSNGTNICYDPKNLNVRVQPDYYIAFGVDEDSIRRRRLYLPWEVGKPPDFALELASDTTYRNDLHRKPGIYARIGIAEYWSFDPTGGELYGEPLWGGALTGGQYRPIPLTIEPDGVLKGYSSILEVSLCWIEERNWLCFFDPATGTYLRNLRQERTLREAELRTERAAQERTQAELMAERTAREADQARIRQLEEELSRLRQSQ